MLQTRTEGKQCRIRAALKLFCQVLSLHRPNSFPVFHTCIILTKKTDNMNCQHAACRITTSSSLEVQNPKGQLQCQVTVQQPFFNYLICRTYLVLSFHLAVLLEQKVCSTLTPPKFNFWSIAVLPSVQDWHRWSQPEQRGHIPEERHIIYMHLPTLQ